MEIALRQAIEIHSTLEAISQKDIPGKTKFVIARLTASTRKCVEQFESTKGDIFIRHGATLNEDRTRYETHGLSQQSLEAIQKEVDETLNEVIDIETRKIQESELENIDLPPSLIEPLLPFIEEDDKE